MYGNRKKCYFCLQSSFSPSFFLYFCIRPWQLGQPDLYPSLSFATVGDLFSFSFQVRLSSFLRHSKDIRRRTRNIADSHIFMAWRPILKLSPISINWREWHHPSLSAGSIAQLALPPLHISGLYSSVESNRCSKFGFGRTNSRFGKFEVRFWMAKVIT